jgi:GNAT superfamily N-acetyltransferase
VDERLAQALAFERGLRMRAARRTIPLPGGVVVLHDPLRRLHHLNALLLDTPLPEDADSHALIALADDCLDHLPHRHVVLDDGAAAERLQPDFLAAGWSAERILFMALGRDPDRPARSELAREVSGDPLRDLERRIDEREEHARGWPPGSAEVVSAGAEALRAGTRARCFGAGEDGELVSSCTLFLRGRVAMLDNVGTLAPYRGRGLARAVVSAAVDAARADGCELIVVPADADDWPRQLYERIGFEPLGTQVAFTLWAVGDPED